MKIILSRTNAYDIVTNIGQEIAKLAIFTNTDKEWVLISKMLIETNEKVKKIVELIAANDAKDEKDKTKKVINFAPRRLDTQHIISSTVATPSAPVVSSEERAAAIHAAEKKALAAQAEASKVLIAQNEKEVKAKKISKEDKHEKELERAALEAQLKVLEEKLKEKSE